MRAGYWSMLIGASASGKQTSIPLCAPLSFAPPPTSTTPPPISAAAGAPSKDPEAAKRAPK